MCGPTSGGAIMTDDKLDPSEEHCRIPSPHWERRLFLRYLPPHSPSHRIVLYVHGGTFPSALSIAHRFDGRSWRDELCAAGFQVWGLDFQGLASLPAPYQDMPPPAAGMPPLGRAEDASCQLEQAVRFICDRHRVGRVSIIAHSWGTIVAGRFARRRP